MLKVFAPVKKSDLNNQRMIPEFYTLFKDKPYKPMKVYKLRFCTDF